MAHNKHYKDFSEQDFINDTYFQDWIIAPDDEKNNFWREFLATHTEKKETIEKARALLKAIAFKESWPQEEQIELSLHGAWEVINNAGKTSGHNTPVKKMPAYRKWWAAAVVLILVAAGGYFLLKEDTEQGTVKAERASSLQGQTRIVPGGDKALLTLADGTRVVLDSAGNGAVSRQGNVTIIKLNGQLEYNKEASVAAQEILYNTVSTPRGGQYQLVLADGTKAWLNSASSLRFPTTFTGNERLVELTGEGYFEVAHDTEKPFIVKNGETAIKVLGTNFNINAYEDEPLLKVTLLDGRVMVTRKNDHVYLDPGQQAILQPGKDDLSINNNVDLEEVIAWKNGQFLFNSAHIETILRQAARWYNVDVVYQGKTDETFSGGMPRSDNISELLKILEATGKVDFTISGTQIIVTPKL